MTTFDTFRPAAATPGIMADILGRLVAWNDRRVTVKMLNALTDRELEDIGLARGNITAFATLRR